MSENDNDDFVESLKRTMQEAKSNTEPVNVPESVSDNEVVDNAKTGGVSSPEGTSQETTEPTKQTQSGPKKQQKDSTPIGEKLRKRVSETPETTGDNTAFDALLDDATKPPAHQKEIVCSKCDELYYIDQTNVSLSQRGMVMTACPNCGRTRFLYAVKKASKEVQGWVGYEERKAPAPVPAQTNPQAVENLLEIGTEPISLLNPPVQRQSNQIENFLSQGGAHMTNEIRNLSGEDGIVLTEDELKSFSNAKQLQSAFIKAKKDAQLNAQRGSLLSRDGTDSMKSVFTDLGMKEVMDQMLKMRAMDAFGKMSNGFFNNYMNNEENRRGKGMDMSEIAQMMIMKEMFRPAEQRPPPSNGNNVAELLMLMQTLRKTEPDSSNVLLPVLVELVKRQHDSKPPQNTSEDFLKMITALQALKGKESGPDDFLKLMTAMQAMTPKPKESGTEDFLKMVATLQSLSPKPKEESMTDVLKIIAAMNQHPPPPPPKEQSFDDFLKMMAAMSTFTKQPPPPQPPQGPSVTDMMSSFAALMTATKPPPPPQPTDLAPTLVTLLADKGKGDNSSEMMWKMFDRIQEKDSQAQTIRDQILFEKLGQLADAAQHQGGDFEDEFKKVFTHWAINKLTGGDTSVTKPGLGTEIANMLSGPFGKVLGKVAEAALQNKNETGTYFVPPQQLQNIQQQVMPPDFQQSGGLNPAQAPYPQWNSPQLGQPQGFAPQAFQPVQQAQPADIDMSQIPPEYAHLFQPQAPTVPQVHQHVHEPTPVKVEPKEEAAPKPPLVNVSKDKSRTKEEVRDAKKSVAPDINTSTPSGNGAQTAESKEGKFYTI